MTETVYAVIRYSAYYDDTETCVLSVHDDKGAAVAKAAACREWYARAWAPSYDPRILKETPCPGDPGALCAAFEKKWLYWEVQSAPLIRNQSEE